MSATDTVTVGRALPKLATVEPGNGRFSVVVTWAAGERVGRTDVVDLAPMIFTFKVFRPLRDNPALFPGVRVSQWGEALVWAEDDDLEIGAEAIEEMAAEVMTNADFAAFLKRNSFTHDAAAAQLGIARRLVSYYAKNRDIPRYIALACKQIDAIVQDRQPSSAVPIKGAPDFGAEDRYGPASYIHQILENYGQLPTSKSTLKQSLFHGGVDPSPTASVERAISIMENIRGQEKPTTSNYDPLLGVRMPWMGTAIRRKGDI